MNKFIVSIFSAAIAVSALPAISATTVDNMDDASSIGTSDTPQIKQQDKRVDKGAIETNTGSVNDPASNLGNSESPQVVEQNMRTDKGPAQNVTEGEYTKKSRLLKEKAKNAGTTKGNKVQPSQPEGAAPATK